MVPTSEFSSTTPGFMKATVVISGMSGTYPKSVHIKDFRNILYNKVDSVAESKVRWEYDHPEVPKHHGRAPQLECFDAQFFKVSNHLARCIDPMARKLIEHTHRAIYDAGLSPDYCAGRNIGVYLGSSVSEVEKVSIYDPFVTAYSMPGCSKTMFANRISYWLDVKGPSMSFDDACCSSLVALEQAYLAIQRGDCEAAIVGGSYVGLHPQTILQYGRILPLCKDGKTKSFDQLADGCAMSDAINVVFLQKAENAMRVYAEIVHVKSEHDVSMIAESQNGKKVGFPRNSDCLANFLQNFYKNAGVAPREIEYVEAFGSGVSEVDKAELETIEKVFCKDRYDALLVGSVASNIGYTEAASGLTALTKVLLGYQEGVLAANLYCKRPRQDINALRDGRMRIVTEHEPFKRSYAAINGFSLTGVNGHILLRGCFKPKNLSIKPSIPYLVNISGRKESSVQNIIEDLKSRPVDHQELALLHNIHEEKNFGNLGRGYVILDSTEEHKTISLSENLTYYDDIKRPLWFVYTGMGSQWAGMGTQLMQIPIFAAAIQRCDKVLSPKGLDIAHIITSTDKTIFDNILHSFVGIAAIQIGLTDVLNAMDIVPDKIIGHSVGELGCAYADGCFTAEEMILSAYSRGLVSIQTKFIHGSMAAVGIGYQEAVQLCPPEIEVACHNGPDSCTISGPADAMQKFVSKLTEQGIFAKEVPCSNIAYHSRYIKKAGPKLLEFLSEVIRNPKRRSERWVSTSLPQDRWNEENAQFSSAWYHTNNLLSPVLFEETSRLVEPGAVLVEVAPHGLLQAILKRSLHPDCRHIPLTKRGHQNNTLHLLEAVGKLFLQGYNPKVKNLYPRVNFPVSTETPSLSHLVEWNYSDKWTLPLCKNVKKEQTRICNFPISIHDEENDYLRGHGIRGKILYPYSAMLVAVWDTLAMSKGIQRKEMSVQFTDIHLYTQPILHDQRYLKIKVAIHLGTGEFEVTDNLNRVAAGFIADIDGGMVEESTISNTTTDMNLDSNAIYDLLQEKDYFYSGEFQSIYKCNSSFTEGQLTWRDNWVTLIDGMLQMNNLQRGYSNPSKPNHIHKLTINLKDHSPDKIVLIEDIRVISSKVSPVFDFTRCGGILIEKIRFEEMPPISNNFELAALEFCSHNKSHNDNILTKERLSISERETTLQSKFLGDLNTLCWMETSARQVETSSIGIYVKVRYAAVNVFDANVATRVLSPKLDKEDTHRYGMDYSGITTTGARVMGMVRGGAAGSCVRAVPRLTWPVPAHWTLEDAATVPLAYAQAFYCLGIKAPLQPGKTILVQGGTGALGQAVISIALAHQCTVFATVRDAKKKNFLLRLYPDLKEEYVGSSRDASFADMVLLATKERGCDIVICCSRGTLKNMTLKCGSYNGVIIDTVQAHISDSYNYGMHYLTKQRSYMVMDFYNIFENEDHIKTIQSMMSEGIARGYVRPLSRVTYAAQAAARAFRLLAASQHRGRVLLRLEGISARKLDKLTCSSYLHQLVVCNEDNFSFNLVDRLIKCGARKFILHSCILSPLFYFKEASWKKCGATIQILPPNTEKEFSKLFKICKVEGIFIICSGKEQDRVIMSSLDLATRSLCPSLKYFTIISSAQNSLGEKICAARHQLHLPGSILYLPGIKKTQTDRVTVCQKSLMDVVETALSSPQRLLKIQHKPSIKTSVLENISLIAGLKLPDQIGKKFTLKDIGFNDSYSKVIAAFLRDSYNTFIEDCQVPSLTVDLLEKFEENMIEPEFKQSDGLMSLFSSVDRDELLAVSNMVILPTLAKSLTVRDDMIDMNEQYLWIVPGLEGSHQRFRTLAERLKIPALVLQPGLDSPSESVKEMAQKYVQVLAARTGLSNNNNFYIVGYGSGVLTAFEMAAILEEKGMIGTVFGIGGTPEQILLMLKSKLKNFTTKESLQIAVLKHMIKLLCDGKDKLDPKAYEVGTWYKRVQEAVRLTADISPYTAQYSRAVIEAAYFRTEQILNQSVQQCNLKSEVVILRTEPTNDSKNKVLLSLKPFIVYDLKAPLEYAVEHPLCASLINRHLKTDVIERFENRNHCEFLTDPDMFVSKFSEPQVEE